MTTACAPGESSEAEAAVERFSRCEIRMAGSTALLSMSARQIAIMTAMLAAWNWARGSVGDTAGSLVSTLGDDDLAGRCRIDGAPERLGRYCLGPRLG
jgi:hypothetical protein